jgi:threonine dehydrogenase-like Zn-dependent dehydrogenase
MMAKRKIETSGMITHRFALRDLYKAYQTIEERLESVVKIMIEI